MRLVEQRRHGLFAIGIRGEELERLDQKREVHLRDRLEQPVLGLLAVLSSHEHHKAADVAGRQRTRGGKIPVAFPQVVAALRCGRRLKLERINAEREPRIERVIDATRPLERKFKAIREFRAGRLVKGLHAVSPL